ncbi:hypothetical protein K2P47_02055 [Patescibacteria group bacterium]|nr:hypothetical protein [Patescibacteria group bacterium]
MSQSETSKAEYKKYNPPIIFIYLWPTIMTMVVFYLLHYDVIVVLCIGIAVYGFLNYLQYLANYIVTVLKK